MGQQYSSIPDKLISFVEEQKLFFVGTATADSRVNISPKGMDSLRILSPNRVVWLNVTGSGNETAAHIQQMPRMTIMFAAFEGSPLILRLYGNAKVIHKNDEEWSELYALFDDNHGARQIFNLEIDLVQSSCGMAVPFFDYKEEREQLNTWAKKKSPEDIEAYWEKKNQNSIDGLPTHIVKKNL
ncbi:pyridoxamine 5'-phosphate oxidase family protein [Alteromonadaceae bacterium M269]|nr:pyridoxamine 5'-phosphate oxidase family protein [Alteromonadaceae bacterium M269]